MGTVATERVQAVQLIRVLAAVAVAVWHIVFLFAPRIGPLDLPRSDGQIAQVAVCAFFIVSGYVMILSSEHLFAKQGASRTFWLRRAVRILPTYWFAIAMMVTLLWLSGAAPPVENIVRSAVFWLYWTPGYAAFPVPVMAIAWTLFFEMLFYLIFGWAVIWRPTAAVVFASGAIVSLVALGTIAKPEAALLYAATRPVSVLFIPGMVMALLSRKGLQLPSAVRILFITAAFAVIAATMLPANYFDAGFGHVWWAGVPALLLCLGLLSGTLLMPGFPVVDRLADASYALYLLHWPISQATEHLWHRLGWTNPWAYAVATIGLSCVSALAFHRVLERPLVRGLNRILGTKRPVGHQPAFPVAP